MVQPPNSKLVCDRYNQVASITCCFEFWPQPKTLSPLNRTNFDLQFKSPFRAHTSRCVQLYDVYARHK
ncbi:hypothetical protein AG1IA_00686 [Rhizoctonia solani AG-1 IA]|uniref:Uncharacterized protein n=1 Tax=Thanatephorus cucumeris (strain AG1-IA) TaxID=983506 RepID=L8X9F0_THACA|nr:hypothetical protein AG1IA_00686 [Rhizoctonia solani AG-1 IA]